MTRRAKDGGEYPEGVVFTSDQHLGRCACGCGASVNMTYNAVLRGERFFLAAHDPLPRPVNCAMCFAEWDSRAEGGIFCAACHPMGTAWLWFLEVLASRCDAGDWPSGFRRDDGPGRTTREAADVGSRVALGRMTGRRA